MENQTGFRFKKSTVRIHFLSPKTEETSSAIVFLREFHTYSFEKMGKESETLPILQPHGAGGQQQPLYQPQQPLYYQPQQPLQDGNGGLMHFKCQEIGCPAVASDKCLSCSKLVCLIHSDTLLLKHGKAVYCRICKPRVLHNRRVAAIAAVSISVLIMIIVAIVIVVINTA